MVPAHVKKEEEPIINTGKRYTKKSMVKYWSKTKKTLYRTPNSSWDLRNNDMLYISKFRGKWFIQKYIDGKQERFCVPCDDLEWVKKERDWLVECDWDWDAIVNQDYDKYTFLGIPLNVKNGRIMVEGGLTYV